MILPFTPEARSLAMLLNPNVLVTASIIAIAHQHTSVERSDVVEAIDAYLATVDW